MNNLIIINKQIANIKWNKEQAIKEARDIMAKYEGIVFAEEDLKEAKKEVAALRKVSKEINAQALAIDKELTEPVKKFRSEVKEVKSIVDKGINYINEQIISFEEKIKQERKDYIQSWDEWQTIKDYTNFDESWLLKKWNDEALKNEFIDLEFNLNTNIGVLKTTAKTYNVDESRYIEMLKSIPFNEVVERMAADYELLSSIKSEKEPSIEVTPSEKVFTITRKLIGTQKQLEALKKYADKIGVEWLK